MFHCITRGGSKGKAGGSPPHLILGKNKKRISLAQGLDPLLITTMVNLFSTKF